MSAPANQPLPSIPEPRQPESPRKPEPPKSAPAPPAEPVPTAVLKPAEPAGWLGTRLWLVTLACLVVAVALVVWSLPERGPRIRVRFERGHGLEVGDPLRLRGIDIGTVTGVELVDGGRAVAVRIELEPGAAAVAREGSRFWIERPEVSLSRVRGLDTVIGAKYVNVSPGPQDAPSATEFVGVETPPAVAEADAAHVVVTFPESYSLTAGDLVKHRGLIVGEVSAVDLKESLDGVEVRVRLAGAAAKLAREGTQFWVERPRVSVTEIRGLDTLVGGRYLVVRPGQADAPPADRFEGLPAPPGGDLPAGGLEVVLEGAQRGGLEAGSPVSYRGQRVGHVVSVGLATDAAGVEARVIIEPDYRLLVRTGSRFWINSGFDVRLGFGGLEFDADTLSEIAAGGVSFATPDDPGEPAHTGERFPLDTRPEPEWLEWRPRIPLGGSMLPTGAPTPNPVRATLRWKGGFVVSWTKQRSGWLVPLAGGGMLGPLDLLTPVEGAEAGSVLEATGSETAAKALKPQQFGPLAVVRNAAADVEPERRWPTDRLRSPDKPEACVVIADPQGRKLTLADSRLRPREGVWLIDASVPLDEEWHGASVVARRDGHVIGVLLARDDSYRIAPLPQALIDAAAGAD